MPIDTFVVLMMENRSFDHYLGWMPEADGRQAGVRYLDAEGTPQETHRLTPEYQGCGHPDPGHGWESGRVQFNNGKVDGWLKEGSDTDEFALGYYQKGDLGFIQDATAGATTFDRFFCSILASTYPNREYMWAAQSYGNQGNDLPVDSAGFPYDTTLFAAVERAGGTVASYFNDLPAAALWGQEGFARASRVEDYYAACRSGTLPNVSFVDPPFKDGGGGDGMSADEHPHGDVRLGQAYMSDVVHAFMESPQWERGAMFIVYDEWGGFFDHVRPPRVIDGRMSRDLDEDFGQMGFRIPAVAVSPFARPKKRPKGFRVDHGTYGHESILKLISYRFRLGFLNKRHRYTRNIGRSFEWKNPDFERPALPDPPQVASQPCTLGGGGVFDSQQAHANDLAGLESLGDKFGFPLYDGKAHQIFTKPYSVKKAYKKPTRRT
jgi:phospholipase C